MKRDDFKYQLADLHINSLAKMQSEVRELASLMQRHQPKDLLHRGFWETVFKHLGDNIQSELTTDQIFSVRLLEYIQNNYASLNAWKNPPDELTEEAWHEIQKKLNDLIASIMAHLTSRGTYLEVKGAPKEVLAANETIVTEVTNFVMVRGDRFQTQEIPRLRSLLEPHETIFKKCFGTSAKDFIDELEKLANRLTFGLSDTLLRFKNLMAEIKEEQTIPASQIAAKLEALKGTEREKEANEIWHDLVGLGLAKITINDKLPAPLLDSLSWDVGQDTDYWKEGDYAGIPVRYTPILKRPFIKLDGDYYCFLHHQIFDQLYRVIERSVRALAPEYIWQEIQKNASEKAALQPFTQILPNAESIPSPFFGSVGSRKEVDGIIIYDKTLIVMEVKAVAGSYVSRLERPDIFLAKTKEMIADPLHQALRFVDELKSKGSVSLYEGPAKSDGLLKVLSYSDYETIIPLAVSIDNLSHLATKAEILERLGTKGLNLLPVGLDDLMMYEDIFKGKPLQFLHFLRKRSDAAQFRPLAIMDETDHLGLYFDHNDYVMWAQKITGEEFDGIMVEDASATIERYYIDKLSNPEKLISPPTQKLPSTLQEILDFLVANNIPNRVRLANHLLDSSGEYREQIHEFIKETQYKERVRPFTMKGNMAFVVLSLLADSERPDEGWLQEYAWATALVHKTEEVLYLNLGYAAQGSLQNLNFGFLNVANIPKNLTTRVRLMAKEYSSRNKLPTDVVIKSKIKVNEPCPCGSGIKYKKCHGKSV